MHVACVANTLLLFSLMSTIDQFRDEGLTVYSLYYMLLMLWLAAGAAKRGTIGIQMAHRHEARP
jgi:hypothetical protein